MIYLVIVPIMIIGLGLIIRFAHPLFEKFFGHMIV